MHLPGSPIKSRRSPTWNVSLSAVYFFSLASVLVWTYVPRYLETIGFTGLAIGTLFSVRTIIQSLCMPGWATLADRNNSARRLVHLMLGLGLLALLPLPFIVSQPAVFASTIIYSVTAGCTMPLLDALTLREVGATHYGRIRAWGSAGFGLVALGAAGLGIQSTHTELASLAPWLLIMFAALCLAASMAFPPSVAAPPGLSLARVKGLLRRPALLIALLVCAVHWASQAPYNLFIVFLAEERLMGAWVPGLAVGIGVLGELIVFAMGARILGRLQPFALLTLSILASALRWYITGTTTSPLVLLLTQILHGLTFGGFFIAIMAILAVEIPSQIRATGQALFYFVVFGVGGALGSFSSGLILDHHSPAILFQWAGFLELALGLACLALMRTFCSLPSPGPDYS